jgi:hypothetical protein
MAGWGVAKGNATAMRGRPSMEWRSLDRVRPPHGRMATEEISWLMCGGREKVK